MHSLESQCFFVQMRVISVAQTVSEKGLVTVIQFGTVTKYKGKIRYVIHESDSVSDRLLQIVFNFSKLGVI